MIGVSHKVFMAKDGTKFHIAEIWCGVAGRDTSDWQGEVPTIPQKTKLKGSRDQQWERD